MEKKHKLKRSVYPYIILAIALVSTVLVLMELWANVGPLVPRPWEGPTPTNTLWWRTPKTATPEAAVFTAPASFSMVAPLETPAPYGQFVQESIDG